jgi:hypothetical protein
VRGTRLPMQPACGQPPCRPLTSIQPSPYPPLPATDLSIYTCRPADGLLEVVGYVGLGGILSMARLAVGALFADSASPEALQDEAAIFGGRFAEVAVDADPPQAVVVDGEVLGTTPLRARCLPRALRVLVPRPPAGAAAAAGVDAAAAAARGGGGAFGVAGPGAASAAAAAAPAGTTGVGLAASREVEASFEALRRQADGEASGGDGGGGEEEEEGERAGSA